MTETMHGGDAVWTGADTVPSGQARIGEVLTSHGLITSEQAEQIAHHHLARGIRFGEAAVELGLVSPSLLKLFVATLDDGGAGQAARFGPDVVMIAGDISVADEIRALRNLLTVRWFNHVDGARTLAVIGPGRGEGRSFVAANLAVSFAMSGLKTLLVDGDMRHARQQSIFGIEADAGLSDYLAGADLSLSLHKVSGLSLVVMPAGLRPDGHELLSRTRLPELALEAGLVFDVVLFDTPSASAYADYEMLSAAAKGALLVMRRDITPVRESKRMLARCSDYGVRMVGSLLLDGKNR